MITKGQAGSCKNFKQIAKFNGEIVLTYGNMQPVFRGDGTSAPIDKPINWRANGKLKTWKRAPTRFKLPIKHGLYSYAYIDETNCHLFEAD